MQGSVILRRSLSNASAGGGALGTYRGNDHGLTPTVTYSDVFPEFTVQRTLKLGQGEDVVRHVQFSTKGTWFAACTRSICYIYQVKVHKVHSINLAIGPHLLVATNKHTSGLEAPIWANTATGVVS
jgi:hypothetical protein